jgi:hypothetical protein
VNFLSSGDSCIVALEDSDTVDLITESGEGEIVLVMSEVRPWDGSRERLEQLAAKVETYLAFVESGQLVEQHPEAEGRPLHIRLDTLERPDAEAANALTQIERMLAERSIRFVVEPYPDELVGLARTGMPLDEIIALAEGGVTLDEMGELARRRREQPPRRGLARLLRR